jgi:hypothetical protein
MQASKIGSHRHGTCVLRLGRGRFVQLKYPRTSLAEVALSCRSTVTNRRNEGAEAENKGLCCLNVDKLLTNLCVSCVASRGHSRHSSSAFCVAKAKDVKEWRCIGYQHSAPNGRAKSCDTSCDSLSIMKNIFSVNTAHNPADPWSRLSDHKQLRRHQSQANDREGEVGEVATANTTPTNLTNFPFRK